jgi:benzil reductase ((S)-benzoin forming)
MIAAIVTGCSRGLGLALTRQLLRQSCKVIGIARTPPPELETALNDGSLCFISADLSDSTEVEQLMARALDSLGHQQFTRLCLINNAGVVTPMAQAGSYDDSQVHAAMAINLTTPILLTNAFLAAAPQFSSDLRILNISSGAAVSTYPGWGIYGASKAGIDHFSRHVALEQANTVQPARIAALYPGVVDTDMQSSIRATDSQQFPMKERFTALKRDGALTTPEDAARQILRFLDADEFGTETVVDIRTLSFSSDTP